MRVLRRRADNVVQLVTFGGLGLAVGAAAAASRSPVGLAVGALFVLVAVRAFRAGVYLDEAELTVRNTFRTTHVPWDDYERADITRAGRPSLPAVVVRRHSGPPVPLWCIQAGTRGARGHERLAQTLRDVQQAVRALRPETAADS